MLKKIGKEWTRKEEGGMFTADHLSPTQLNPELQEKHEIKSVPTVIIFDDDEEVKRFEANIMMELEATKKDIQKEIDKRQQLIDFLNKQLNDERKDNEKSRKSARRKK